MPDTYKLQYDGMTLTYPGWGGYVGFNGAQPKSLTLYHSEGGSLTADTLTGYPGDTINLSTAYNTYWRFSGYQWTGDGELVGNAYTFGTEDATICACYKVNAFTASGGWEKGSNVNVYTTTRNGTATGSVRKYAITGYRTSNVPTAWYSTSNRWNPNGASAYKITLNPRMTVLCKPGDSWYQGWCSAQFATLINNSYTNTANYGKGTTKGGKDIVTANYNKNSITSTVQSTYSISSYMRAHGGNYAYNTTGRTTATYVAANTTGTWVATGYAP